MEVKDEDVQKKEQSTFWENINQLRMREMYRKL